MKRLLLSALVLSLLILLVASPVGSEAEEPPTPPSLWILTASQALHHAGEDGALLQRFQQLEAAESLAVDEGRGAVWVLSAEELAVWGLDGVERFRVPLLARGGEPGTLLLRAADGSVWLVQGSRLESFGEAGQRWVSQELPAPAVEAVLSPDGERLWVATEEGVDARDALSGEVEQRLVLPLGAGVAEPRGLAVGPDGSVWVALAQEVAVYGVDGELRERVPVSGITEIEATAKGFWGANGSELVRWERREGSEPGGETRSLAFQPFDGAGIAALAVDPRGGVWVGSGSEARRFDEAGNLLDAVDAGEPVRALVVGGPAGASLPLPAGFADGWSSAAEGAGAGPEIGIVGPEGFLQINPQDLPAGLQIELTYSAGSAALDLGSLTVRLDGDDITASCQTTETEATCPMDPAGGEELAAGEHVVTAEIADGTGRTASAQRAFWVLLGEGEQQVALPAVADSFIGRTLRNRNRGDAPYLQLRWAGRHRSLTVFDLSEVEPVLDSLLGARLELFIEHNAFNWGPSGREVDVHRLLEPWSEAGVTWTCAEDTNLLNFRPDCLVRWDGGVFDPAASASTTVTSDQLGWVSFDVTADVAAALAGEESFGWLLKKRLEHRLGLVRFTSREGLWEQAPRLVLDFVGGEPELPDGPELPPDPVDVAPDLDRTVTYDLHAATEFLYTGDDPIQAGVEPGTLDPRRIAVMRGQVFGRDGEPLPGVKVAVLDHPELGWTLSRADGWFDLAVNGGGIVTLDYSKEGYLPVQRQVRAPWRDWAFAEEAVLLPYDSVSTAITGGAADAQVARGSVQTDADGSRQATVVFPAGTTAEIELGDGTVQPLPTLTLRATEYTVGPLGPDAMPGPLPPTVAYTYAVELSADEAEAAGAVEVRFSQPVYLYVENFLGFPVGERVPLGYWDRRQAAWIGAPNGRVVEVLVADGTGRALVDVDGSGQPADAAELAELGFTNGELERLAALYAPGTQLWRSPIPHLTPWDCNFPYAPPDDAVLPPGDEDDFDDWDDEDLEGPEDPLDPFGEAGDEGDGPEKDEDPCEWQGSVLECRDQVLGESLSLPGSEVSLHYRSDRQVGRTAEYRIRTRVTTDAPPGSLQGVELDIYVAGQRIRREFGPEPGQVFSFTWDGRDGYQRSAQGRVRVKIIKRYVYTGTYRSPATSRISWGRFPERSINPPPRNRADSTIYLERTFLETLENTSSRALGTFDARDLGLGGWNLSVHHVYNPDSRTLYLGDGSQRRASWLGPVLTRLAGTGVPGDGADNAPAVRESLDSPSDVAVAPSGAVYVADTFNHKIRRIAPDGRMTTVAGTGEPCAGGSDDDDDDPTDGLAGPGGAEASAGEDCGDDGPATAARLSAPEGVAVAPDGALLVADTGAGCVRRIDALGTIRTVAGQCRSGGDDDLAGLFPDDGLPAVAATLASPTDIEVAPDGSFYLADPQAGRVVQITPDGILNVVAGGGSLPGENGDAADQVALVLPSGVALGPAGDLYVAEAGASRVRRVSVDGRIFGFAGTGQPGFAGDGGAADLALLIDPVRVTALSDGSVYISDSFDRRVRKVDPSGVIRTVAGTGQSADGADGGLAAGTPVKEPAGLVATPSGELLLADLEGHAVLRMGPALEGFGADELVVPARGGGAVHIFDSRGRHLRTQHSLTGADLYRFEYDPAGRLSAVVDVDSQRTTVQRNGSGEPERILTPSGQEVALVLDPEGYLQNFVGPAEISEQFRYRQGLMEWHLDPRGAERTYEHDSFGRLQESRDRSEARQRFVRHGSPFAPAASVTAEDGGGNLLVYKSFEGRDGAQGEAVNDSSMRQHRRVRAPDGRWSVVRGDGVVGGWQEAPDPRFGMAARRTSALTTALPGGPTLTASSTSNAELSDPDDPLSVASLLDVVTVNGHPFTSLYDGPTRTATLLTPEGRSATTRLDAKGRVVETTRPGFAPVVYSYRDDGLVESVQVGTGASGEADAARVLRFTYDGLRRLETVTDPLERVTRFTYDAANRPLSQILPDGSQVAFTWDAGGNLEALTPPGRLAHSFGYTPRDEVSTYSPPGGTPAEGLVLGHRPDRQLEQIQRAGGEALSFAYDELGRLSTFTHPDGQTTLGWDFTAGQVGSLTTSEGSTLTYGYQGHLLRSLSWSGPVAGTVDWSFNPELKMASMRVGGSALASYDYDRDGLLTQAGELSLIRDAANGRITGTIQGSLTTDRGFNPFGELTSHRADFGGTSLYDVSYQRDALGRIAERTETIQGQASATSYVYDPRGRLQRVERDGALVAEFGYDANGNRTSLLKPSGSLSATHDDQDRLLTHGDRSYTYTAAGELESETQNGQSVLYDYDALGNLRSVQAPGAPLIEYLVDGENRRIGKKVDGLLVQGWLYADLLNPVAELDGGGNVVSRFVYGDRGNVPAYLEKGGRTYRIVADPVGSVRLVVDVETGAVAQRLDYGPFGQILLDTHPGFQPFGFAGGLYDAQTGLIRFGVRDYDPRVGRWTAKDPLGFAGGDTNFYAYVANDPINRGDPSGQILPALALGYAAFEVALTLYDLYDAWDTISDPCADLWDKALSAGGVGLGAAFPGGGYGVGAKAGRRAASNGVEWTDDALASLPVGRRGAPLKNPSFQPRRNEPTDILGREYSGHALDQIQNRGLTPTVVENTIQTGTFAPGRFAGTGKYFDPVNNVTAIVDISSGRLITAY